MDMVKNYPELGDILKTPGMSNNERMRHAVAKLKIQAADISAAQKEMGLPPTMDQATFYVSMAQHLEPKLLEEIWILAFGDVGDNMEGCGKVVNTVNKLVMKSPEFASVAMNDNGNEVFVATSSVTRRIVGTIGAAG